MRIISRIDMLLESTTKFFIRFAENEKFAKADLKRGYSMVAASDDKEYLKELAKGSNHKLIKHPFIKNYYALKLRGLNGYGPYDTEEEALEAAEYEKEHVHGEPWKDKAQCFLYTGDYIGDDGMGGDMFIARKLIRKI